MQPGNGILSLNQLIQLQVKHHARWTNLVPALVMDAAVTDLFFRRAPD